VDKKAEIRAEWSEDKKRKVATGQREHQKIIENLSEVLNRRNALSGKPMPPGVIDVQIQSLVCVSDLAALVDCLENMGKIDRVEFMAASVNRLGRMLQAIERPN
jgi:hypothetical protein